METLLSVVAGLLSDVLFYSLARAGKGAAPPPDIEKTLNSFCGKAYVRLFGSKLFSEKDVAAIKNLIWLDARHVEPRLRQWIEAEILHLPGGVSISLLNAGATPC